MPAATRVVRVAPPLTAVFVVERMSASVVSAGTPAPRARPGPPLGKCYGLRQLPPSREMNESASAGPQVPAS